MIELCVLGICVKAEPATVCSGYKLDCKVMIVLDRRLKGYYTWQVIGQIGRI